MEIQSLHSLFRNTHLIHVKRSTHRIRESIQQHLEAYTKGASILDIAKAKNFPPYLLARLIVEKVAVQQSKKLLTEAMRDPERLGDISALVPDYLESEKYPRPDLSKKRDGRCVT